MGESTNIKLSKSSHKRVYIVWFHLHQVQEQAKIIYGNTGENGDYFGEARGTDWEEAGESLLEHWECSIL